MTAANPRPVTLKMEKVYYPCILQTKKRYVGFSYESPDQVDPIFDAKGIETVRRDSCPAVAKMLEACLRILFSSKDLSAVKEYCTRQWSKILSNRVSVQVCVPLLYRYSSVTGLLGCLPVLLSLLMASA